MTKIDVRGGSLLGADRSEQYALTHPFEPAPPVSTFQIPPSEIDPDQSKGWIRRLLPILRPHAGVMIGSVFAWALISHRGKTWGEHDITAGAIQATMVTSLPLPPKQRTAVALRFVLDADYALIASSMQTSEDAARRNVHEGLKRLRTEYTP